MMPMWELFSMPMWFTPYSSVKGLIASSNFFARSAKGISLFCFALNVAMVGFSYFGMLQGYAEQAEEEYHDDDGGYDDEHPFDELLERGLDERGGINEPCGKTEHDELYDKNKDGISEEVHFVFSLILLIVLSHNS